MQTLCFTWIAACMGLAAAQEIPFQFLHNQIVVEGSLNGQGPLNFIIDTGTRTSIVDLELARRLNLPIGNEVAVAGAGNGRASARHTVCPRLSLGELTVRDLDADALDLSSISRSLGRPLHGVLGFSFLASRIVQIDYFQRIIRILREVPRVPLKDERFVTFPMQFRVNSVLPLLEDCWVNGTRLSVTLDTGSSLGLILFPRAIERLGLTGLAEEGIPLQASGYVGPVRMRKGWVRSVRLGTLDLGAIEVAYVQKGYADSEDADRRAGNVGNAVLQDFVLTLNYRDQRVTLESRAEPDGGAQ
jgi:hypothetical protein